TDGPGIEAKNTAHSMVDRTNAVRSSRVRTRLPEHAVAISEEVGGVDVPPEKTALLERVKPVIQDLGIGPQRVGCVCALDHVLVQEDHGRLDEPRLRAEEEGEPGRPWSPQGDAEGCRGSPPQCDWYLLSPREPALADDLNHVEHRVR